ncbi:MAG: DUF1385 domain-containing protein [Chloroflexota bacterium]
MSDLAPATSATSAMSAAPAAPIRPRFAYGGQALMEGVLMRGKDAIAVALRHPDGRIVTATERLDSGVHGKRYSTWPFIRGLVVLYETLVIGTRWLIRSANVQAEEDDVELGKGSVILMLVVTFGVAIAIFSLLPLFISSVATEGAEQRWAQPALEGVIQVGIFLGYLTLVSRTPDIHRVFQYHGAEHMTIHALENGDPLTVDEVRKYPTAHHRCGTEFLVVLVMLSIFTFSLVGRQEPLVMIGSRLALIPVLAAVGYEILRLGARHRRNPIIKVLMYPGILVQMITTKRPEDDMIEVAITSMQEALVADGNEVPTGSTIFDREPMDLARPATTATTSDTAEPADSVVAPATVDVGESPPLA